MVFLLLVGQLWLNTAPYCCWMANIEMEHVELCNAEDCETEKENNEKKSEHKIPLDFFATSFDAFYSKKGASNLEDYMTLHHPDILTPPPRASFFSC